MKKKYYIPPIVLMATAAVVFFIVTGAEAPQSNDTVLQSDQRKVVNYTSLELAIAEGRFFVYSVTDSLGLGAVINHCFQTPGTNNLIDFAFLVSTTQGADVKIYENSTITYNGTNTTAFDYNRRTANTSGLANFQINPTITALGNRVFDITVADKNEAGRLTLTNRIPVKSNVSYTFEITSTAPSNEVTLFLEFEEFVQTPRFVR